LYYTKCCGVKHSCFSNTSFSVDDIVFLVTFVFVVRSIAILPDCKKKPQEVNPAAYLIS